MEQTRATRSSIPWLPGRRRAAILLSLLSPEEASSVLRHLEEREVTALVTEMMRLDKVDSNTVSHLVSEGLARLESRQLIVTVGAEKVRTLLMQVFGAQQGAALWGRLEALLQEPTSEEPDPELLSRLGSIPPQQLVELVRNENPQAIALFLGLLPGTQGAAVLSELPPELRSEVALRLLITEPPPKEVLDTLRRSLQDAIAPAAQRSTTRFNGLQVLVQILSNMSREVSQEVLAAIEQRNPALAERVQQALFTFEDLIRLDDRAIQRMLREVDMRELALALKGASEELKEKMFRNMSQRAAQILQEEMDYMGPVRLRDVSIAQRNIVNTVLKLEEAGEITVPRSGEEVLI